MTQYLCVISVSPLLPMDVSRFPLVFGLRIFGGNTYGNYAERKYVFR